MKGFVFNQRPGSQECGWRCLYSILATHGKTDLSFRIFLKRMRKRFGIYAEQLDLYEILRENDIEFGSSFPTPTGTYMVFYPIPNSPMWHSIIYNNGVVYDSETDGPINVPIRQFIHKIRPKGEPDILRGLICIEIFGVLDSDRGWKKNELSSKSRPTSTKTTCSARASSLMVASLIGGSMKSRITKLRGWVRSSFGQSKPISLGTSSRRCLNS